MTRLNTVLLRGVAVAALGLPCVAKTPTLTGKMVAYDPLLHANKSSSVVANKESVVLEVPGQKARYIKVVFVTFGTTQLEQKYFDGTMPLTVKAIRDHTCDDRSPKIAAQVSLTQASGTYLLTDAFKNSPPPKLKILECYDATQKK